MTTIDAQGNIHDRTGQFSEKHNTAPSGGLVAPGEHAFEGIPAEFFDVWDGPAEHAQEAFARGTMTAAFEPGDAHVGMAIRKVGAESAWEVLVGSGNDEIVARLYGAEPEEVPAMRRRALDVDVTALFRDSARAGVRLHTAAEGGVPAQFADLQDEAPYALWTRGDDEVMKTMAQGVSFTGSRAASSYGEHVAAELAGDVASRGQTTISGGAYGIEGAVIRASQASGGKVAVFMAGGLDRPYPVGHSDMLNSVAERGGVLISEMPVGSSPTKHRLAQRHRLMSAASKATIIVEAGSRSGSDHSVRSADGLRRFIGAVPGPVTSATSLGTNDLIKRRVAEVVMSSDDIPRAD